MKTEQQLIDKSNEIIDSLKEFSLSQKYRIIKGLWESLNDLVINNNGVIVERK